MLTTWLVVKLVQAKVAVLASIAATVNVLKESDVARIDVIAVPPPTLALVANMPSAPCTVLVELRFDPMTKAPVNVPVDETRSASSSPATDRFERLVDRLLISPAMTAS